jgi:hypothetical protein
LTSLGFGWLEAKLRHPMEAVELFLMLSLVPQLPELSCWLASKKYSKRESWVSTELLLPLVKVVLLSLLCEMASLFIESTKASGKIIFSANWSWLWLLSTYTSSPSTPSALEEGDEAAWLVSLTPIVVVDRSAKMELQASNALVSPNMDHLCLATSAPPLLIPLFEEAIDPSSKLRVDSDATNRDQLFDSMRIETGFSVAE